jgi:hypothetical protein
LACESTSTFFDQTTNQFKEICNAVGVCNKYTQVGRATTCSNFISDLTTGEAKILDLKTYTSRDTTFKGEEYSGYSLYNKFPIEKLSSVNVGGDCSLPTPCEIEEGCECQVGGRTICFVLKDEKSCHKDDWKLVFVGGSCSGENGSDCTTTYGRGKCWDKKCVYSPQGKQIDNVSSAQPIEPIKEESVSCRAYPEVDSPFPKSIESGGVRQSGFSKANICEDGGNECECNYKKVEYKSAGVTKYYSSTRRDEKIPEGICQGGLKEGQPCNENNDCNPDQGGTCAIKTKQSNVIGWQGYCLERDKSRNINGARDQFACLTWLPVDHLPGVADIYNQYVGAGYAPALVGAQPYYCLEGTLFIKPKVYYGCVDGGPAPCGPCHWGDWQHLCPTGYHIWRWGCAGPNGECERGGEADDCAYFCIPNEPTNNPSLCGQTADQVGYGHDGDWSDEEKNVKDNCWADYWVEYDLSLYKEHSIKDYILGCKVIAQVGGGTETKAWTNRLYPASYQVVSNVLGSGDKPKLNYVYQDPRQPFGFADPPGPGDPLRIPDCRKGLNFELPNPGSDLTCPAEFELKGLENNTARPYMSLAFGQSTCGTDADCNTGVICNNQCYKTCTSNAECNPGDTCITFTEGGITEGYCKNTTIPGSCPSDNGNCGDNGTCIGMCNNTGKACNLNEDCYEVRCIDHGCAGGSGVSSDSESGFNFAVSRLNQLFAKAYIPGSTDLPFYEWRNKDPNNSSDKGGYKEMASPPTAWDITETGITNVPGANKTPAPPAVFSLGECRDAKCTLGFRGRITVNGKDSGDIISREGILRATIQFFAFADPDQMPIKQVVVHDGSRIIYDSGPNNSFKNSYGYKTDGTSACDKSDFGHTPQACTEEPFNFTTTFICTRSSQNYVEPCPNPTISGGCCVFQPKVQVKDNWGWCNGRCPGRTDGCYGSNECGLDIDLPHWTTFAGQIIVVPK